MAFRLFPYPGGGRPCWEQAPELLFLLSLLLTQRLASPHSTTGITRDVFFFPLRKMGGITNSVMHNEDEGARTVGAQSDAPLLDNVYPSPALSGRCGKG